MVHTFKHLYPEKKAITGWRGDEIEIDHMYVFQEMFAMAMMQRTLDDPIVNVREVCDRLGVAY